MNDNLKNYEAPVVEIIQVEIEKGFAASSGQLDGFDPTTGNNNWL